VTLSFAVLPSPSLYNKAGHHVHEEDLYDGDAAHDARLFSIEHGHASGNEKHGMVGLKARPGSPGGGAGVAGGSELRSAASTAGATRPRGSFRRAGSGDGGASGGHGSGGVEGVSSGVGASGKAQPARNLSTPFGVVHPYGGGGERAYSRAQAAQAAATAFSGPVGGEAGVDRLAASLSVSLTEASTVGGFVNPMRSVGSGVAVGGEFGLPSGGWGPYGAAEVLRLYACCARALEDAAVEEAQVKRAWVGDEACDEGFRLGLGERSPGQVHCH